jgi:hypothetical protein
MSHKNNFEYLCLKLFVKTTYAVFFLFAAKKAKSSPKKPSNYAVFLVSSSRLTHILQLGKENLWAPLT